MSLLLQEPKLISLHGVVSSKIYQLIWSNLRDLWSALLLCFASHKCTAGAGWQKNIVLEKSDLTESKAKMFTYLMGSRGCLPASPCPQAAHFPVWVVRLLYFQIPVTCRNKPLLIPEGSLTSRLRAWEVQGFFDSLETQTNSAWAD